MAPLPPAVQGHERVEALWQGVELERNSVEEGEEIVLCAGFVCRRFMYSVVWVAITCVRVEPVWVCDTVFKSFEALWVCHRIFLPRLLKAGRLFSHSLYHYEQRLPPLFR